MLAIIEGMIWDEVVWQIRVRLSRIYCWFVGHNEVIGEQWYDGPDYCSCCEIAWPSEETTLPSLLNRGYCWLVERNWRWFNHLDEWLFNHVSRRWWPQWWEY